MLSVAVSLLVLASEFEPLRLLNHTFKVYVPVVDGVHVADDVIVPVLPDVRFKPENVDDTVDPPFTL